MRVFVHGHGLSALVSAAALAGGGHEVLLACGDEPLAAQLRAGQLPFDEPGLAQALQAGQEYRRLEVAAQAPQPTGRIAVHFLALQPEEEAQAHALLERIAAFEGDVLLVNQVNFRVGATDALLQRLRALRADGRRTAAASFPDFLRRGTALANFRHPDRLILGVSDPWGEGLLRDVLLPCTSHGVPVFVMPARDAEFAKQAVNGMLATRLSYMNDMANVADVLGIDIENVRLGVGSDERIGGHFLHAGCGFGGTGFYQDLLSLKTTLDGSGVASRLVDTALRVNEEQKELLFRKLWMHFRGALAGRTVAVWGIAFKADTDRIDHAPSLTVIDALLAQGVIVRVHDPKALPQLRERFGVEPCLVECADPYAAAEGADALLVLTEWQVYRAPDFQRLRALLRTPLLLDGRNLYDPQAVRACGLLYQGIGRR